MGRHPLANPHRKVPSTLERRDMLYKLAQMAHGKQVYEYDLPPWMVIRLLRCGYVRRVEKGVLEIVKPLDK